jgi:hypothetical protein
MMRSSPALSKKKKTLAYPNLFGTKRLCCYCCNKMIHGSPVYSKEKNSADELDGTAKKTKKLKTKFFQKGSVPTN